MAPPSVLMVGAIEQHPRLKWRLMNDQVGTGEYTTGFVGGGASGSDKKVGVVGLTMFDLRRRGKVGDLSMVGVSGKKFAGIRKRAIREEERIKVILNSHSSQATIFIATSPKYTTAWTPPSPPSQPTTKPTQTPTRPPSTPSPRAPPSPSSPQTQPISRSPSTPSSAATTS